jgi:imidazole glycerol-phosphate synthase subunit HisF
MLKTRIIPCLDVADGRVVKGVNFVNLIDAGDPVEAAKAYDDAGADELCFLDIHATHENRGTMFDLVTRTAEQCFMPLTVGGGVRSPEDVRALLLAGADKVSFNSAAVADPDVVAAPPTASAASASSWPSTPRRCARPVGDLHPWRAPADRHRRGGFRPHRRGEGRGRDPADLDGPRRHARGLQPPADPRHRRCGAGPGDRLGRRRHARSSGRGGDKGHASAVLAASIFHFGEFTIAEAKAHMAAAGIPVRPGMSALEPPSRLAATIAARKGADPAESWTAKLLARAPRNAPRSSAKRPSRR